VALGEIEVADGQEAAMGDIVLLFPPNRDRVLYCAASIRVSENPARLNDSIRTKAKSIAAVYTSCSKLSSEACGTVHIVHADGAEVKLPADKEQVGTSSISISQDKRAAGWLVDYNNCCTSYPLSLKLMIYRPGRRLREFRGDGRAIFHWGFVTRGKQFAFLQSYPHGNLVPHYELRDVETGRLVDRREDSDPPAKLPAWASEIIPLH
jgi:hypothetical protein